MCIGVCDLHGRSEIVIFGKFGAQRNLVEQNGESSVCFEPPDDGEAGRSKASDAGFLGSG
jgi:hypothetical protein